MMGDFSKLPNWLFPRIPAFNSNLLGAPSQPVSVGQPTARKGSTLALRTLR